MTIENLTELEQETESNPQVVEQQPDYRFQEFSDNLRARVRSLVAEKAIDPEVADFIASMPIEKDEQNRVSFGGIPYDSTENLLVKLAERHPTLFDKSRIPAVRYISREQSRDLFFLRAEGIKPIDIAEGRVRISPDAGLTFRDDRPEILEDGVKYVTSQQARDRGFLARNEITLKDFQTGKVKIRNRSEVV